MHSVWSDMFSATTQGPELAVPLVLQIDVLDICPGILEAQPLAKPGLREIDSDAD